MLTLFLFFFVIIAVFISVKKDIQLFENPVVTFIQEEIDDIKTIDENKISESSPHFDLEVIIYDFSDGRVTFEVNVFNPKVPMNQVFVSAFLGDNILRYLNTPHSLVSNIIAVKKADKSFRENFNLIPNGEIKEISVSSNMVYFENKNLNDVLEAIPYILIKVSWFDENNRPIVEYVKYTSNNYNKKTSK